MLDFVKVLYKRRWVAATALLIVIVGALVHAFTAVPIYEARTRLLIEGTNPNIVSFQEVLEEGQATADYYQTQYGILRSRGLARRTIARLNLWRSPHLVGTPDPAAEPVDEQTQESRAVDAFLARLEIEPIKNSRLVDVTFQSPSAELSAKVANALATSYIEQTLEYRFNVSQDASNWLGERLAEQRKQVEAAEAALQQYREQHEAISLADHESIVVQKLEDLNAAVTRAKMERLQKEALEQQLRAVEHDPAQLDTFPAVLGNAYIQRLKSELADAERRRAQLAVELGESHPEMRTVGKVIQEAQVKLRAEVAKIVQSVHSEYAAAVAQERSLSVALQQQKGEALAMNRNAIEYSVLARDVESAKQIYQSLLQRANETGVSGELRTSNIRVVDEAETPRTPSSPRIVRDAALSLFGGVILAIALAFLFEYLDSRLKSPEEVQGYLGLSALGMIPELGKRWAGGPPMLDVGAPANFSEAMRTVRTNILFSWPDEGPRTLAVTSAVPGEGKTMIAANLAAAFALAGQRVLLVDADLRRPRVHQIFGTEQDPGLSNVLVGQKLVSDCIKPTRVEGLSTLAAGRTPPNPAELLGSKRFKDILKMLSDQFDLVVVDTPPVMAVADPSVVTSLTSGVVFVVGAEMTGRHTARAAIEQLQRGQGRILGAILNRVRIESNSYYYNRYYRKDYVAYYRAAS